MPIWTCVIVASSGSWTTSNSRCLCEYHVGDTADVRDIVGALLLRHTCQLVSNAHAITTVMRTNAASSASPAADGLVSSGELCSGVATGQSESTGDDCTVDMNQQVRVATAIYPTASLMNHSCDPSIISRSR